MSNGMFSVIIAAVLYLFIFIFCFVFCLEDSSRHNKWNNKWSALPMVQLLAVELAVQEVHDPSICRHVPGLQLGEQTWEQFVPKYPSLQASGYDIQKHI